MDVSKAVEEAAKSSYGRLLAFLAARTRDVAAAEDALADAFLAALRTWPANGIPDKPEAWLLTTARRRLINNSRHANVHIAAVPTLVAAVDEAEHVIYTETKFPDERLKLLFVCAHPAIDSGVRTALMLQTVLGMDAVRIGSAFLVRPATMGQRLSRAKTKIRDAGIPFEVPEPEDLLNRLNNVLEAIYAVYGCGWDDVAGADPSRSGLSTEAIALGRLLLELCPSEPEVCGLLALMLHCEARRHARRSPEGKYIPLAEQDVGLWLRPMIEEAEELLRIGSKANRLGRFQLEAAIQSAYAGRAAVGRIEWDEIAVLYEGLTRIAPSIGALVGRAAAVSEAQGDLVAWSLLQSIPEDKVITYQPFWALAAHLLGRMLRIDQARVAYERAIGLCEDTSMKEFLGMKMKRLLVGR